MLMVMMMRLYMVGMMMIIIIYYVLLEDEESRFLPQIMKQRRLYSTELLTFVHCDSDITRLQMLAVSYI
jgi:hypothetical protein